jgi:subtilisin family serine protease
MVLSGRMLPEALVAAAFVNLAAATANPRADDAVLPDAPIVRSPNRKAALKLPSDLRDADVDDDDAPLPYLVDLRDQLDFERAATILARKPPSRKSQRAWVRKALASIAARGQRRLQPLLEDLRRRGDISSWTGVSIVNRLVVTARPHGIRALAASAEVDSIVPEIESQAALEDPPGDPGGAVAPGWPLDAVGARDAWRLGFDGRGVTVGIIDSGASRFHEQLRDNFRGGPAAWFDPLREDAEPWDVQTGHGTGVLSCAVGQGKGDTAVGVAPGAGWIAAVGLNGGRFNNVLVTRAADWMLNVGQPDVLILAFRAPGTACDDSLRRMVNALRAAEMVVVFAAGNGGPEPATDVSPANYLHLFPGWAAALSVGAVDSGRKADPHSSRGPSRCGSDGLFPQLVAPGSDVRVAVPAGPSLYRRATGSSFAAGYAAGASAVLLQAFPGARVDRIEEALREGAIDLGPPGPDSTYGHGLVNIPRALQFLKNQPRPHE